MHWPLIKNLPTEFHFRFTKYAPVAAIISGLAILGTIIVLFTMGLNLGTDFAGGNVLEVQTPGPVPVAEVRAKMKTFGAEDPTAQTFGSDRDAVIKFKLAESKGGDDNSQVDTIKAKLGAAFPGMSFKRTEVVGPKVSGELLRSGVLALGAALLLMLLYIAFRFPSGFQFGSGAVIAVLHDVILTVGIMAVLQIEFSMTSIAALLTVIGYSMNEKVITFDRLRENLRKFKKTPLADIINLSENERLSRTIITGSTAVLALAGMLFLGGPALFPLVFAMVFGIVIGTYSSIYVALPIILVWGISRNDPDAEIVDMGGFKGSKKPKEMP
ncbi:MAG TPA: protein translocase subunit SecF [Asticcacaulis sp.]|nr:protein translocase subunit SecF [Asticcacaulis sp.]